MYNYFFTFQVSFYLFKIFRNLIYFMIKIYWHTQ